MEVKLWLTLLPELQHSDKTFTIDEIVEEAFERLVFKM